MSVKEGTIWVKIVPTCLVWNIPKVMIVNGYKQSQGDHTLFIKHLASGGVTTLIVYMNDIIVTGNDAKEKNTLMQCLAKKFEIKDLGKLKYFIGIEVARSKQGNFISQQKYVIDLLGETGIMASKPVMTLIEQNHRLSEALGEKKVDRKMYQQLIGRLIYLAHTRPNITYSVSVIS